VTDAVAAEEDHHESDIDEYVVVSNDDFAAQHQHQLQLPELRHFMLMTQVLR